MKIAQAKKIIRIYKGPLSHWSKSGGGYAYWERNTYLTIGNPTGVAEAVNLATISAKALDDCTTTPYEGDTLLARDTSGYRHYPAIQLGVNFVPALKRSLKIISAECPRNYGTVAMVTHNGSQAKIVATDSFALYEHTEETEASPEYTICIGVQEVKAITEFFDAAPIDGQLSTDKTTLILSQGYHKAYIRLSQVKYPNYKPVMPEWSKGHIAGNWHKDTPKVKGAISARYESDKVTYYGKPAIKDVQPCLGTVAIKPIKCARDTSSFASCTYNPAYIDFVNASGDLVQWHQATWEPFNAPTTFRTSPRARCTETIVIVPISA